MKGRIHNYEGYDSWEVVIPIRVCHMLGASKIILTNSVGTLDPNYKIGDLTVVTNCISKFIESPLVGPNIDQLGERFPDTSKMYDANLNNLARECAKKQNISLKDSVYIQFNGPNFETSADAKMARQFGATTIGMSSVVDAIAAAHMNMQICDIGCITANSIDGAPPMSDEEVRKAANASISNLSKLILEMLK